MRIFKCSLEVTGVQEIIIPRFVKVLSVALQYNVLVLYALVGSGDREANSTIEVTIIGTGHEFLAMTTDWEFQGTHLQAGGSLVWHVWTRYKQ